MIQGAGTKIDTVSNVPTTAGAAGPGMEHSLQKDATEASTDPKFSEVLKSIQANYGAKADKPREIKKTLGKDDFLRIMITQMRHQDPTNPFKAEQMAAEMAQFTSVEQLQNLNATVGKLANQNQPLERLAMTNLIGKVVTIDRERFPHNEGSNSSLSFGLPRDATEAKIAIVSESGETILEKDLGPLKVGANSFTWDGKKSNTLTAKSGTYIMRVEARDEKGQKLQTNPQGQARVIGVSFEGPEAVFLVGDNRKQDRVTMKNIVRIESDVPGMALAPTAQEQKKPNFVAFQKGVGSSDLDLSQARDEAAKALGRFELESAPKAQGFPNGLSDPDENQANLIDSTKGGEKK
jgi:flagellar basal-body rod modification protein FlgD